MDVLNCADVQATRRLHSNQKLRLSIDLAGDNRLLLVAAGHSAGSCNRALTGTNIILLNQLIRILANRTEVDKSARLEVRLSVTLKHQILLQCIVQNQAVLMTVFRNMTHTKPGTLADTRVRNIRALKRNLTCRDAIQASQGMNKLRLAVALDARKANNLATANLEGNVLYSIVLVDLGGNSDALDIQDDLCGFRVRLFDLHLYRTANHHGRKLLNCRITSINSADVLALAQNRAAVGHRHNLRKLMGDEKDGLALFLEAAHNFHQFVNFLRSQNSRRLVENQDFIVTVEHFKDFNALLHTNGDILNFCVGVDSQAILFGKCHNLFSGLFLLKDTHLSRFDTKNNIIQDGKTLDQLKMLMHHADMERSRIVRVTNLNNLPIFLDNTLFWLV